MNLVRGLAAVALLALAACGGSNRIPYVERPVDVIYNTAMDALTAGDYAKAAREFDEVERQHPYSVWASRAQLMVAFSYYQGQKYDDAILAAQRYIQLHPGSRDTPYAYYLAAISYYEQIVDVGRDQKNTENALSQLDEIVRRFPDTEYARDARLKIDLARDHLAGKEMEIGRYYLRQGEYLSAINRFKQVVDTFQTTTHTPEALHRMTEAYLALGLTEEAQATSAVLGHNFPGSDWYRDSYRLMTGRDVGPLAPEGGPTARRSMMSRAWNWVF